MRRIIITLLIVIFIIASFISVDNHHIEICNDENCAICSIIKMAQKLFEYSVLKSIYILLIFSLILIHSLIIRKYYLTQKTLVCLNVQFNE